MATSEAQVRDALAHVTDPILRRGVVEVGMVRSVRARWGRVSLVLALPTAAHPRLDELRARVRDAVTAATAARDVEIELVAMTDAERAEMIAKLVGDGGRSTGEQGRHAPLGHEQGRPNPFMRPESPTRVLALSSGKGGVGKSSVTVNLAVALARRGHRVGVLDADVYGFSVPKMLGVDHDPMVLGELVVPPVAHEVAAISIGFFIGEDQPVIWRGPMLHKALEQFLVDVWWGDPDYLLVDMPPGTGDVALSMGEYLPKSEVFVVTTPQPAAQRVAQRSALAAKKLKLAVRGVVENMSWFTGDDAKRYELFGSGGGERLASDLGVPLLASLPLVPALREGGDEGVPVTVSHPDSEASVAFDALADRVESLGPVRVYKRELTVH